MWKWRIPKTVAKVRKFTHKSLYRRAPLYKVCLTGGPCGGKTMGNLN